MDEWPPGPLDDDEAEPRDDRPAPRGRDRFGEAVGDAWESGLRRDPYIDEML